MIFAKALRWLVGRMLRFSYLQLATIYIFTILAFGFAYFALFEAAPGHAPSLTGYTKLLRLVNSIYFSAVTALSVGYGDIVPHGISKILAGTESFLTLFIFGFLVAKPISEKQEAAVYQMHKLTIDDIFRSTREGFFIMRRDLEAIADDFRKTQKLSEYQAENFVTACKYGEVLMENIPVFYDTQNGLYRIDTRRETLLSDAVERTFERLQKTITVLGTLPVETSAAANELKNVSASTIQKWLKHSSSDIHPTLKRISLLLKNKK